MVLMDTHVWWWALSEPQHLSKAAIKIIRETKPDDRYVCSISIWEFAMMADRQKIELKISAGQWLSNAIHKTGIRLIELSPEIAIESCELPGEFHKDPADRLIVASARIHNLTLVTKDQKILDYPYVKSVW